MPNLRVLVFLGFLFLFPAIPFLGNKEAHINNLPAFQTFADDSGYQFVK